jgi:uncharacterized protein YbjT (DUF2867 family)
MEIFLTGATGYLGSRLVPLLLERGHALSALVRPTSSVSLPAGCEAIVGDPLARASFASRVRPGSTFVQLVGTPRPAPWKGKQFRAVDLVSVRESVAVAAFAQVAHFVYLSVAQPAPVMRAYIDVRAAGERMIREAGLVSTILRPWYVLGPGHRWAALLTPVYALAKLLPASRATALRLDLVTLDQMLGALVRAVENPPRGLRIVEAPGIRAGTGTDAGKSGESASG